MSDLQLVNVMLRELVKDGDDFYKGEITLRIHNHINEGWCVELGDCAASSRDFFQAVVEVIAMAKRKR